MSFFKHILKRTPSQAAAAAARLRSMSSDDGDQASAVSASDHIAPSGGVGFGELSAEQLAATHVKITDNGPEWAPYTPGFSKRRDEPPPERRHLPDVHEYNVGALAELPLELRARIRKARIFPEEANKHFLDMLHALLLTIRKRREPRLHDDLKRHYRRHKRAVLAAERRAALDSRRAAWVKAGNRAEDFVDDEHTRSGSGGDANDSSDSDASDEEERDDDASDEGGKVAKRIALADGGESEGSRPVSNEKLKARSSDLLPMASDERVPELLASTSAMQSSYDPDVGFVEHRAVAECACTAEPKRSPAASRRRQLSSSSSPLVTGKPSHASESDGASADASPSSPSPSRATAAAAAATATATPTAAKSPASAAPVQPASMGRAATSALAAAGSSSSMSPLPSPSPTAAAADGDGGPEYEFASPAERELFTLEDPLLTYPERQLVATGGFGIVFQTTHPRTGDNVALKFVKRKFTESKESIVPELVALAACRHESVIAYEAFYLWRNRVWISFEFADGGTLRDLCRQLALGEKRIKYLMREVIAALAWVHHVGYVHRDIKSENILLWTDGRVKLADLGCCILDKGAERKSVAGSVFWMAPEVMRREQYSTLADSWSLGCLMYEMMTGAPPWYKYGRLRCAFAFASNYKGLPVLPSDRKWSRDVFDMLYRQLAHEPRQRWTMSQLMRHPFMKNAKKLKRSAIVEAIQFAHSTSGGGAGGDSDD